MSLPVLIVSYLIPDGAYQTFYRTDKHIDFNFVIVGLLIYAGFVIGTFFALRTGSRPRERDLMIYCRWFVWPLFALTMFGYVVWFGFALLRSGGVMGFLDIIVTLTQGADPGYADFVKTQILGTIGGVTTLTQVGILYVTVEALLWFRGGERTWVAAGRFSAVAAFTMARVLVHSERLGFIEVAIPVLVVWAASLRLTTARKTLMQVAPFVLGVGVFVLFAVGEYFRSWSFYRGLYPGTYMDFAVQRFFGYYATAVNNGAIFHYFQPPEPLRYTFNPLFAFPVIGDYVRDFYYANVVDGTIRYEYPYTFLLAKYGNPEFNNVPPIGTLPGEYSMYLAPLAAFGLGLIAASLHRSFLSGKMLGLLLYPSWFIGLIEVPRIYFWADQRYFPALAALFLSLVAFHLMKVPARSSPVKRPRAASRSPGAAVGAHRKS